MKTHNPYSAEVSAEKQLIRDHGGYASRRLPSHAATFKAQALRQLALCELMREKIEALEAALSAARAMIDGVSPEEMAGLNGYDASENRKWMAKVYDP